MPKISVIIPCFNAEKYIEKCLDSVLNSTLNDIEVIAVDDGSKDNTSIILDKYANKDKRVIAMHKKNEGVAMARNIGLERAAGEYIAFVDSDDYIEENMLELLYKKAKEKDYDMVACDVNLIYPNEKRIISSNIDENDNINKLMVDAYAVIWNKIYKRKKLETIRFKKGISFCEDVLFLYMVYVNINSISSVHIPLYNYIQREGSLTYTYNERLYDLVVAMDEVVKYYKDNHFLDTYYSEIEYSYVRYLFATFMKRLAKTKNKKEYKKGYLYVKRKVFETFPKYQSNKYLKGAKGLYLKLFSSLLASIVYIKEKNSMN